MSYHRKHDAERLDEMQQQFDRFLDHLRTVKFQSQAILAASQARPPVDLFETAQEVVAIVELAGVRHEDLEVSVQQRKLRIRGVRHPVGGGSQQIYHQMEIESGPFDRTVTLPAEIDPDSAKASWENGMLQIRFAKLAPRIRRVTIRSRSTEMR